VFAKSKGIEGSWTRAVVDGGFEAGPLVVAHVEAGDSGPAHVLLGRHAHSI